MRTPWFIRIVVLAALLGAVTSLSCGKKPEEQPELQPIKVRPSDTSKAVQIPQSPYLVIPNELVVMLKDGETVESFSESVAGKGIKVVGYIPDFNIVQVEVPSEERETLKNELARNPLVKVVSYQTVYGANAAPNDPALINDDVWDDWGLKAIGAEAAWDVTRGDPNVIIAIVDTGMLIDHEELKGRIVSPKSFFSDDGVRQVGSPDDMMHATHVAIIAAGSGNNSLGTSGVAPGCRIMPVQVLYDNGSGELGTTTTTAAGIAYAIRNNARVINLSLAPVLEYRGIMGALAGIFGSLYEKYRSPDSRDGAQNVLFSMRESDALLHGDIFAKAEDAGVTVVEAAGNDDLPGDFNSICYDPFTLGVGNVGKYADGVLTPARSSNYGYMVRVSAPGTDIYSGSAEPGGNGYVWLGGTSMAAPYVSGLAALIASANPDLKPSEIRQAIIASAISGDPGNPAQVRWDPSTQEVFHEMDLWRRAFLLLTGKDENLLLPDTMQQLLVSLIPPQFNLVWDGAFVRRTGEVVRDNHKAVGAFINAPAALRAAADGSFRKKFAAFTPEETEKARDITPEKLLQVYDMLRLSGRYAGLDGLGGAFSLEANIPSARLNVVRDKNPGGNYVEWLEYTAPARYRHFAAFNNEDYRQGPVRVQRRDKVVEIWNLLKDEIIYYPSVE